MNMKKITTIDIVRQKFEEVTVPSFTSHPSVRDRKSNGEYVDPRIEDHWQTFQEAWEECEAHQENAKNNG